MRRTGRSRLADGRRRGERMRRCGNCWRKREGMLWTEGTVAVVLAVLVVVAMVVVAMGRLR